MLMDTLTFSVHANSNCIFLLGEENADARRVKDGEIVMFHLNVNLTLRFIMQRK